jgi:hypothetical protein
LRRFDPQDILAECGGVFRRNVAKKTGKFDTRPTGKATET